MHEIPHLVWYDRREQRVVEYGSSFQAVRAAGIGNTLRDTLVNMNGEHLGARAVTMFEALADAGLRTAAVNFTAYRGRTRHRASVPFLGSVDGPERFFFYNLFSSDRTGAPLSWRNRAAGSVDAYAAAVGRWLVTRDAFDFLLFYLSDYDYASHAAGPDTALEVLRRCDDAIGSLAEAAGGVDALLERYAVVVMSDHGQTHVREAVSIARGVRRRSTASFPSGRTAPRTCTSGRVAGSTHARSRRGSTACLRRRSRCSARGRARSRVARARSSSSRPRPGGGFELGGRRDDPRPPRRARRAWAALGEPERGRGARLGGRGLRVHRSRRRPSRRRRLARLARAPATPRCRSSRVGVEGERARASSTSRRSSSSHFGVGGPDYASTARPEL